MEISGRANDNFFTYFKGRNFLGQKVSRAKNFSRFAAFGTNFAEKTFAGLKQEKCSQLQKTKKLARFYDFLW